VSSFLGKLNPDFIGAELCPFSPKFLVGYPSKLRPTTSAVLLKLSERLSTEVSFARHAYQTVVLT
jgi:hypothetical protein